MQPMTEFKEGQHSVWFAEDGEIFVTFYSGNHIENHPLLSPAVEGWIRRTLRQRNNKAPSKYDVETFKNDLQSKAYEDGIRGKTALRVGESEGKIYIDLGTSDWKSVEISDEGWKIVPIPAVAFRRNDHMQALPMPEQGGSLALLKDFISLESDDDFLLLCSWLVSALHPKGPYFHLLLTGEKGSTKSSAARLMQSLVHPSSSSLKGLPKDEDNLAIEAYHNRLVMIDNENDLGKWVPNALCRLSTGTGMSARTLYSQRGQSAFSVARPAIITSLQLPNKQEDLLQRSLHIRAVIPQRNMTQEKLEAEFEKVRGKILGAIFDAISSAISARKNMPEESLQLHRMADASYFIACAAKAIGWLSADDFLTALKRNQMSSLEKAGVDNTPLIKALCDFMQTRDEWCGEPQALLDDLNMVAKDTSMLPKAANALSRSLNSLQTYLMPHGLRISTGLRSKGGKTRQIYITKNKTIFDRENNTVMRNTVEMNASNDTTV